MISASRLGPVFAPPVPAQARLPMPTQSLGVAPPSICEWADVRTIAARITAFGGTLLLTAVGADQMMRVFDTTTASALQVTLAALFVITFAWISFSAANALAGVLFAPPRPAAGDGPLGPGCRTAIVMPVYNESPDATAGALAAMGRGLADAGHGGMFEIFVLSDTRDPAVWARETTCFAALRAELAGRMTVWYRRRARNTGRKAGNLQDFVERWGGRYDFMLVLDADSLMEPATIVEMVRRMAADPKLGLLQTVPVLTGGVTPFARLQQFAARLYGRAIARGVAAWQGFDGNFWGHNALIRVHAFAESAGLPVLSGRKPFGGHVLSHDFVEAALMRRAGWRVRMDPDLEGSWEGAPPSLTDAAIRDRRWAQGNLQHAKVIGARGLRMISRVHMGIGICSYLASPVWLAMIVVGLALTTQALYIRPEYFPTTYQIFPDWPRFDAERMQWLFAGSMALLLLPKVVGILSTLIDRRARRAMGGAWRVTTGAVAEILLSALYAPILMLIQCRQIAEILLGRDSGWAAQSRNGSALPWRDALRRHGGQTMLGVVGAGALAVAQPALLLWFSPILLGLALAPILSRVSGDARIGSALGRLGLLTTPEDDRPPPLAREAAEDARRIAAEGCADLAELTERPQFLEAHVAALSSDDADRSDSAMLAAITARAKVEAAATPRQALTWLTQEECVALLSDPLLLTRWSAGMPGRQRSDHDLVAV